MLKLARGKAMISLFPCLKSNVVFCFDAHKQNKTINRKKKNGPRSSRLKNGRIVRTEESQAEIGLDRNDPELATEEYAVMHKSRKISQLVGQAGWWG